MEHRNFGDTDLGCSVVGFGTWEMGGTQYGDIDLKAAVRAVEMAVDHGITLFDTAEVYGPFTSEELLAKGLGARRKDVVVVTKVGFAYRDDDTRGRDASPANITVHAEDCLRRLDTDYIDLLLIHWPDHKTPHDDTIGALEALKDAGKIRHYGVSNYDVPMMRECERHGHLTANQVGYHLFDRRMEAHVLPFCGEAGIGFMSYGSLGFGLLTGAMTPETTFVDWDWRSAGKAFGLPLFEGERFRAELLVVDKLKAFAADHGKSVAQLAIAWVLGNPALTVALVGMRNEREHWQLSDDDRRAIDRIFEEEDVPTYVGEPQAR
ncbi:MAG: aldo/keto reductase [Pseudomonadales bacterium]|nr:aldo/keto reductase [Pseudomonadales bacterium]